MDIEIIIYLAVMVTLYLYMNWRGSSGFFWVCIYFVTLWIIEEYTGFNFGYSIALVGTGIGISYEILSYLEKDPFSEIRLTNLISIILNGVGLILKGVGVRPKISIIDPKKADDVQTAIDLFRKHRWDELDSYLKHQDPNDRYRIIQAVVDIKGRHASFDIWIEKAPQSAMAHIVSGHQYIHWAWEARGSGLGTGVSEKNIGLFFERLLIAKENLEYTIELDKNYSDSYVGLMTIAMGTGLERENIWNYFAKALVYCNNHYQAHRSMINAVAQKWGGEEGEMFVVAHQAAVNAQLGSPLAGIVAEAHIEQWLYLLMCDQEEEAGIYFREKDVRDDLRAEYEKIKGADTDSAEMVATLNNFAFCFYMADLNSLAREVMAILNDRFFEHPWDYLGSPFMANFDTGFAIDHVKEQLNVVTTDLPDIIVQRSRLDDGLNKVDGTDEIRIKNESEHYNRRIFKMPIIVPVSVLMVILIYAGYPLITLTEGSPPILDTLKSITFELFIFCEIGLIGLFWSSGKQLVKFLGKYPAIHNDQSLEAFKVIARTNMISALMALVFLGVGSLMAIMTIVNYGWAERIIVLILLGVAAAAISLYNGYEERMKQIECLDKNLEDELNRVIHCWMHKALPCF